MSIYQSDPDAPPDEAFEPGTLAHLVPGNTGRLLDARRTPITVVELRPDVGEFVLRIDAFEDRGAHWRERLEGVHRYQFQRGSPRAGADAVRAWRAIAERFARALTIPCPPGARAETDRHLATASAEADAWLVSHSRFIREQRALPDPTTRTGDPVLADDLRRYLDHVGVRDLDDAFAEQFVRNPRSGERIKGHRIVIAELGLAPFHGTVVRDPTLFDGPWSRDRRARHVLARLGFVRALFHRLGHPRVHLFRGLSAHGALEERAPPTFLSTSFSHDVARSHHDAHPAAATRWLAEARVPVERLFMTYHETAAMNAHYKEAEAVVLVDVDADPF